MNSVLDTIKKRRSVRSYLSKPVPRDILNTIIEAGNQAPSAMNSQPWRFVVVEDSSLKQKLLQAARPNAEKVLEQIRESNPSRYELIRKRYDEMKDPIFYSASAIVFIIGSGKYADNSCPLACENIMLAAHSLGIGSCWVGFGSMVTEDAGIRAELALKDDEKIYGPILLGYPDVYPEAPEKKPPEVKWI